MSTTESLPTSPTTSSVPSSPPPVHVPDIASPLSSPPAYPSFSFLTHKSSEKIPVWLDCDPGHDDAMAIVLAGYNPRLELVGISSVHGNQSVNKTTANASSILRAAGLRHVKVVPGQAAPLLKSHTYAPSIHGDSGLDGTNLPPGDSTTVLNSEKAVPYMASFFHKYPKRITLIATGPLTNVALLLTIYPEVKNKIDKIVFMGGSMGRGNWTPTAEFNIYVDPDAAQIVFNSGLPIVMVPIDVTHKVLVHSEVLSTLVSRFTYRDVFGFHNGPPLHDPCAVAYVADPSMFTVREMRVDVVTEEGVVRGQTVCDVQHQLSLPKNLHVALTIDESRFFDMMYDAWASADERSPLNDPSNFVEMIAQPATVDPLPYLRQATIDKLPITYLSKDGKPVTDIQHAAEVIITVPSEASERSEGEAASPRLKHLKFLKNAATSYRKATKETTDPSKQQFYTLDALLYMLQAKDQEFSSYLMEAVLRGVDLVAVVDRTEAIGYLEGTRETAKGITSVGKK